MKKLYSALIVASLMLAMLPAVMAVSVGSGITPTVNTEKFAPLVWMCDNRVVVDDNTEPGRFWGPNVNYLNLQTCENSTEACITQCLQGATSFILDSSLNHVVDFTVITEARTQLLCRTTCVNTISKYPCPVSKGNELLERINNYAFEGEKIEWLVLVMDKNGNDKVQDVFATIGDSQGAGNDIEANCARLNGFAAPGESIRSSCNARISEERITQFDPNTMAYYECTLTVETPESMYGQYWITVEAVDIDGLSGVMAENEYWFLNPVIALSIDGDMTFDEVRPGSDAYSSTMLVGNDADDSSGVLMDMFISGTDFYDSSSSGAKCPFTNQLGLQYFRYFATNGAYNTAQDFENDVNGGIVRDKDTEGYVNIDYGIGFNNPRAFYDAMEIIQAGGTDNGNGNSLVYYPANLLAPGAEMAVTFKLSLPEPCNGDFDTGSIYFWGEAI